MELFKIEWLRYRLARHIVFWLSWVLGFTFIKSFGESFDVYIAWFVYYIFTLPIFIAHTYLLVYLLAPRLLKGPKIILFIFLFVLLLYLFSFIEMMLTNEVLARFYPAIFDEGEDYWKIGNVFISGVGNLYIILVFVAAKMVRSWYLNEDLKKDIVQKSLELERADVNAGIQPEMLLFITKSIEDLARKGSEEVSTSIALLSDLMNEIMMANEIGVHRVDEEIRMLKKLVNVYSLLKDCQLARVSVLGEDLHQVKLPSFMIFSPVEIMLRDLSDYHVQQIEIKLEAREASYSAIITIIGVHTKHDKMHEKVLRESLQQLYPEKFSVDRIDSSDLSFQISLK